MFVPSNSISPYLRTTEPTCSRQPTVLATTVKSAEAPPRSPAPVSTEGRSGYEGRQTAKTSKVGLSYHRRQGSSPHSLLSDAPWLNRRRPALGPCIVSLNMNKSSSSSSSSIGDLEPTQGGAGWGLWAIPSTESDPQPPQMSCFPSSRVCLLKRDCWGLGVHAEKKSRTDFAKVHV